MNDTKRRLKNARNILQAEANAVLQVAERLDHRFSQAVEALLDCGGCVILSGIGKAGAIAQKLTATLASTGTPSHFLHPAEAVHGDLGRLSKNDIVLMFSQSGETEEVVRILPSLNAMNIPLIAVTASEESTLARYAKIVLPIGKIQEADSHHLAPSTSTTVMLALGDALALVTSAERGFRAEHFAQFHPGGSLGRKLSLVDEYMRPRNECRIAPDRETVREIFMKHRVAGRRSGAVMLIDETGRLSGIFTDSDLARLFELRNDDLIDSPIRNLMTKTPAVLPAGSKMLEAVAMMAKRKISELPILDEDRKPLGMIDITDVVAGFPEYARFAANETENENNESQQNHVTLKIVA